MKTFETFKATLSESLKQLLNEDLVDIQEKLIPSSQGPQKKPHISEQCIIQVYDEYPGTHLSAGYNEHGTIESLTLSVTGNDEDFREGYLEHHLELIPDLRNALFSIFSETTNSDVCSYSIEFDTNHLSDTEPISLKITITDYLS